MKKKVSTRQASVFANSFLPNNEISLYTCLHHENFLNAGHLSGCTNLRQWA